MSGTLSIPRLIELLSHGCCELEADCSRLRLENEQLRLALTGAGGREPNGSCPDRGGPSPALAEPICPPPPWADDESEEERKTIGFDSEDHVPKAVTFSEDVLPPFMAVASSDDSEARPPALGTISAESVSDGGRPMMADVSMVSASPTNLKLWPEWTDEADEECDSETDCNTNKRGTVLLVKAFSGSMSMDMFTSEASTAIKAGESFVDPRSILQHLVLHPGCKKRMAWELLSCFMLLYDMVIIPLQAFPVPPSRLLFVMDWIAIWLWTCDLIGTFFVGYYDGGFLEMRPSAIATRYLRSNFILDFGLVVIDWTLVVVEDANVDELGILRVTKSLRITRALRLLHFLRLFKVMAFMRDLDELMRSEGLRTCLGVFKLVLAIVMANHYIACGWYALGSHGTVDDPASSWLRAFEASLDGEIAFEYRYFTSLHWSLTQFTPASMEVVPKNVYERMFTVAVIICALVSFSSFVSSITNAMTHLRRINEESLTQKENVRRYILENKLSFRMGNLIYAFLRRHRDVQQRRLQESDIQAFKSMPENLRMYLHYETFQPTLAEHSFLEQVHRSDKTGFMNVCHFAIRQACVQVAEDAMVYGVQAEAMQFVFSGRLVYHQGKHEGSREFLEPGAFVCEMAVWVQWNHRGRLVVQVPCQLLRLDAKTFRDIMSQTPSLQMCRTYARRFVTAMSEAYHPSDLWALPKPPTLGTKGSSGLFRQLSRM